MKVRELIESLQELDPELPVYVAHPHDCCCGDCFLPSDSYVEVSFPTVSEIRNTYRDQAKTVVLLP